MLRPSLAFILAIVTPLSWCMAQSRAEPAGDIETLRAAYRSSIAERLMVKVMTPDAQAASAGFEWSIESPTSTPPTPGVVRLDLGRLQIEIEGETLVAVHRHNPGTMFRVMLDPADPIRAMQAALPPLPIPQLEWALNPAPSDHLFSSGALVAGLPPLAAAAFVRFPDGSFRAALADGWTASITRRADVSRGLASLTLTDADGRDRLDVRATLLGAPLPRLSLEGRETVPSIRDLRPAPAEIPISSHLPTPGLMNRAFEPWSLSEALTTAESAGLSPIFVVLVVFDAGQPGMVADAAAAHHAAAAAIQSLRRRAKLGEIESAAFILKPVAMLPVDAFVEASIAAAHDRWLAAATSPDDPVWSSAGPAFITRLVPGSAAAIIVLDAAQTVMATIPVDARRLEPDSIRAEVEAALAVKLRLLDGP